MWNASDEWKHGMFVFPIAIVLLFFEANGAGENPGQSVELGPSADRPQPFPLLGRICGQRAIPWLPRHPIHARRVRYLVFRRAFFQSRLLHLVFPVFRLSVHFFGRPRGVSAPALDE